MKTNWATTLIRVLGVALAVTLSTAGSAQAAAQAYMSASDEPFGDYSNFAAMSAAFGNWDHLDYGASFSSYSMLYIDGGSESAPQMVNYLNANRGLLETYVLGGGRLFINAATEYQTSFGLVFGATSNEQSIDNRGYSASAVDPTSTLFDGAGTSWNGFFFSHNDIAAPDSFSSLIVDDSGRTVLSGGFFGDGYVMLGGQTNTSFHEGVAGSDPFQLRVNELLYASAVQVPVPPVPEPSTYLLLMLGLAGMSVVLRKRQVSSLTH